MKDLTMVRHHQGRWWGERVKMPHEMLPRLVVELSARAVSIMMKSGDFNLRESNPGFCTSGSCSSHSATKCYQAETTRTTSAESRVRIPEIKSPDFITMDALYQVLDTVTVA